jgi:TrmH family RNA methyltransferase
VKLKEISSRHNATVARYRALARTRGEGMLLDGVHLVQDALAAAVPIRHAIVARESLTQGDVQDLVRRLEKQLTPVVQGSSKVMAAVSPVRSPSVIVAIADRPSQQADLAFAVPMPLLVIACDVQEAGNLGALVRVSEAVGASGLIAAGHSADPFGWKTLRGSMGSALRLPVLRLSSAEEAVALARRGGCRIVATVPRRGEPLFDTDLKGPLAILVGGEGAGLPAALVGSADKRVMIPMEGPVESLNAAVAAAILVYEVRRQRIHELPVPR